MDGEPPDATCEALSAEILSGMRDCLQHPEATLRELEAALDERWYRLRARMLQDLTFQSTAAHWKDAAAADRPTCPACGMPLTVRGKQPRHTAAQTFHELRTTALAHHAESEDTTIAIVLAELSSQVALTQRLTGRRSNRRR
jgi:hypothetical protein